MTTNFKPLKINDIDINNIKFSKLEDSDRVESQKISYIRYKNKDSESQLRIQSCEICNEVYGIPMEDKYHPDAKSRAYYKLGFCHERKKQNDINYKQIEDLYNLFVKIDEHCSSEAFKKEMFGNKFNDYEYQSLIKRPEQDDDQLDKNGKVKYRPPCIKLKLDFVWQKEQGNINNKPAFLLFEKIGNSRKQIELETFEDAVKNIPFLSKLRFVIHFSKLYAMKTKMGSKKNYGIILKATHVEVTKSQKNTSQSNELDIFCDSDSDVKRQENISIKRLDSNNLDEEEDEEDEDEDEDEEEYEEEN